MLFRLFGIRFRGFILVMRFRLFLLIFWGFISFKFVWVILWNVWFCWF